MGIRLFNSLTYQFRLFPPQASPPPALKSCSVSDQSLSNGWCVKKIMTASESLVSLILKCRGQRVCGGQDVTRRDESVLEPWPHPPRDSPKRGVSKRVYWTGVGVTTSKNWTWTSKSLKSRLFDSEFFTFKDSPSHRINLFVNYQKTFSLGRGNVETFSVNYKGSG